jgi:hypothetical protein
LKGAFACEALFEHPGDRAVNFWIRLFGAAQVPKSPKDAAEIWAIGIPSGDGALCIEQQEAVNNEWWAGPRKTAFETGYYGPIPNRRYTARVEVRGTEIRLFIDGGLVGKADRSGKASGSESPMFLGIGASFSNVKIHSLKVVQIL